MLLHGSVSLHNKLDNYLKGMVNMLVLICNTFTLSLIFDFNILIVQFTCMFLLTHALKGFNSNHGSKSKVIAKWISVIVSHSKLLLYSTYNIDFE